MIGMDKDLITEAATKFGVTAVQLENYILTGIA
jgi:hypothetical protein